VRRPVRAGGLTLRLQELKKDLYIPYTMMSNNHDWDKAWFYLRNDDGRLPAYTGKILMERPDSWGHGVSPPERQAKLEVYTDALCHLAGKGLTLETLDTVAAGGQSSGQRRAGTEPPAPVVGERTHVRKTGKRMPARSGMETLRRVSPPRHQVGLGVPPVGCSTGACGPVQASRSGSRKRKLDAASR
jgi:hypothetical protein